MFADELIYLRKLEETDLERTWMWINSPEIFYATGSDVPISTTDQKRWFNELDQTNNKIVFAICLLKDNKHIGNVSLDLIHYRHRTARLSIFIADPNIRGQGIGSRAMRLLIEYAFDFLNLQRLYLRTTAGNPAVVNFYQNLGFKIEGHLRKHEYIQGQYVDKVLMGLLCEDLNKRNVT